MKNLFIWFFLLLFLASSLVNLQVEKKKFEISEFNINIINTPNLGSMKKIYIDSVHIANIPEIELYNFKTSSSKNISLKILDETEKVIFSSILSKDKNYFSVNLNAEECFYFLDLKNFLIKDEFLIVKKTVSLPLLELKNERNTEYIFPKENLLSESKIFLEDKNYLFIFPAGCETENPDLKNEVIFFINFNSSKILEKMKLEILNFKENLD